MESLASLTVSSSAGPFGPGHHRDEKPPNQKSLLSVNTSVCKCSDMLLNPWIKNILVIRAQECLGHVCCRADFVRWSLIAVASKKRITSWKDGIPFVLCLSTRSSFLNRSIGRTWGRLTKQDGSGDRIGWSLLVCAHVLPSLRARHGVLQGLSIMIMHWAPWSCQKWSKVGSFQVLDRSIVDAFRKRFFSKGFKRKSCKRRQLETLFFGCFVSVPPFFGAQVLFKAKIGYIEQTGANNWMVCMSR